MELAKLLMPGAVRVLGQVTSKKRLFQELGEVAASAYGLNASVAIDGLQERESLGPTGVGHGIALPHARLLEYDGAPHGLFASHKERFTADLLNFLQEGNGSGFSYASQGSSGITAGLRPAC